MHGITWLLDQRETQSCLDFGIYLNDLIIDSGQMHLLWAITPQMHGPWLLSVLSQTQANWVCPNPPNAKSHWSDSAELWDLLQDLIIHPYLEFIISKTKRESKKCICRAA